MLRRSHKKSRRGCLECKRRHMKCDETRPSCLNCVTAERTCSYPAPSPGSRGASSTPADLLQASSSTGDISAPASEGPSTRSSHSPIPPCPPTTYHPSFADPDSDSDSQVNILHIHLFHHFLTSTYNFLSGHMPNPITDLVKDISIAHSFTSPFLMHQMLAVSARHKSCLVSSPSEAAYFRDLASSLQTRAVALFNRLDLESVTPADRVAIFMFSSTLGFSELCDVLSARERVFGNFLERYRGYVRLHRGVHMVIKGSWELLLESELRPVLDNGAIMFHAVGTGSDCDDIKERIEKSVELSEEEKEGCRAAVRYLQCVFDARPRYQDKVNVILAWAVMVPEGFVQLLDAGRGEALCVLAYYFVLLGFCGDIWFLGDNDGFLLRSLNEHLGSRWAAWLARPNEMLRESMAVVEPGS